MPPRIRLSLALTIGVALTPLAPARSAAQSTIIKVIGDDHRPVPFAWVVVRGGITAIANERGELSLGAERHKTLAVDIRRIGYQPWSGKIKLPDSASTQIVTLSRLAHPLAGMTVTSSASKTLLETEGFYERWLQKQQGAYRNSTFIGPEMIAARNASLTTDLLDRVLNLHFHVDSRGAVAVIGSGMRPPGTRFRSNNSSDDPTNSLDDASCFMNVFIDGGPVCPVIGCHYVFPGDPPGTSIDDHTIDINKAVTPKQVAGIEVYPRRDGMPQSVQDLWNGCGVILIWTNAGK